MCQYLSFLNIFGPPTVAGRVLWNRVCLSFRPSFCPSFHLTFRLSGRFLGIVSLGFSKSGHCTRRCAWQSWIFQKNFLTLNIGKMDQKWAKNVFWIYWKILPLVLLNLFYNENFYYLLCSSTNPKFGKILVPEIWAKMFSPVQVAGFFNQPYLQNK